MTNLYARLVRKEDDRTEALADLLERLLAKDRKDGTTRFTNFVSGVLLGNPTDEHQKTFFECTLNESLNTLRIETQHYISDSTLPEAYGKTPDIVVFKEGKPVCVVEVKVDAKIADGQLERYGAWLIENADDSNVAALVLLTTYAIRPPETFRDSTCQSYGVGLRSIAYWNDVSRWFGELATDTIDSDALLTSLAREFSTFLKEGEMPTLDDVAVARNYYTHSHQVLTDAVDSNMRYVFPDDWRHGQGVSHKPVGIYRLIYPDKESNSRGIYYGLCFKPVDENDDCLLGFERYENGAGTPESPRAIEDGFYAFVYVYAPAEQCAMIPGFTRNQWYRRQGEHLVECEDGLEADSTEWYYCHELDGRYANYGKVRPIQEMLDEDGYFENGLQEWTRRVAEETECLLRALSQQAG